MMPIYLLYPIIKFSPSYYKSCVFLKSKYTTVFSINEIKITDHLYCDNIYEQHFWFYNEISKNMIMNIAEKYNKELSNICEYKMLPKKS